MAIDRQKIIDEISRIRVQSNQEGLIPEMGVYIQVLPTDFWNKFSARMIQRVPASSVSRVEDMLYRAGHECGYYTGHGIINSNEWARIVGPMIEKSPEDILRGAYAVFAGWGWANADIVELVPQEKMVVKATYYYEAVGAKEAGISRPFGHMIRGVSAAFMDLAYGAPFPGGFGAFQCVQTKAIEAGDQYGEFLVTKR